MSRKVAVKVVPYSRQESVEVSADNILTVRVNAIPSDGAANERVIILIAKHYSIAKSKIRLVRGQKSKQKIFEISD